VHDRRFVRGAKTTAADHEIAGAHDHGWSAWHLRPRLWRPDHQQHREAAKLLFGTVSCSA